MDIQDFIITPIYLILFLIGAYMIRPYVTDKLTAPYFIPGLLVKFTGAIALGLIYQFYYTGGDTFTYHTHGSHWIWTALMNDFDLGVKIFFQDAGQHHGDTFVYTKYIWMFRDKASMVIIKIAAFFDLFTLNTYSATALFFAAFAFSGHWALFSSFQKLYPDQTKRLAFATLFIPSVVFWGSGLLKDSVTLAALCWMTYAVLRITISNKYSVLNFGILFFMAWLILSIKIYILLCFLAGVSVFLYSQYISKLKAPLIKIMLAPILFIIFLGGGYLTLNKIAEGDARYSLDKIGETAMVTAYDIRYGWGARNGDNSGYTLGNLDGSIGSMFKIAPQGAVVTLFRPWLWEVKNPLMLLAALESLVFLILTLLVVKKHHFKIFAALNQPLILFCITFALLFAIAVGISTFNFGTLMRYKIPVMPFYAIFLILIGNKRSKL
ncbi:MAG: hypothetical protein OCD76_22670 [Reichenbachiella sp.]